MHHYMFNISISGSADVCGQPFKVGYTSDFYTAEDANPLPPAVSTTGAEASSYSMGTDLWKWLGPVLGVLALLLLAMLILACLKLIGKRKRDALAATSKDISEVSYSKNGLEESNASLDGSRGSFNGSQVLVNNSSNTLGSAAYNRSAFSGSRTFTGTGTESLDATYDNTQGSTMLFNNMARDPREASIADMADLSQTGAPSMSETYEDGARSGYTSMSRLDSRASAISGDYENSGTTQSRNSRWHGSSS
jgi:hypothetical protein